MKWNWQLPEWPHFKYDKSVIAEMEKKFLINAGGECAYLKTLDAEERHHFTAEILSIEGVESSKIEGELLERESLQSSIKRHFGLKTAKRHIGHKEKGMADLLCHAYESFNEPLTHEALGYWHSLLFSGDGRLEDHGQYRTHEEPMQIVSSRYGVQRVYFEAPPSNKVPNEMQAFVYWFNEESMQEPVLVRASVAHVYFESIHPFEDGNGRIGRAIVEKSLSQRVGQPLLLALSIEIDKQKKRYYEELEKCNRSLNVSDWIVFFSEIIINAQNESIRLLKFLINKSKLMTALSGQLNQRQEKVLLRIFAEGVDGFKGGLSAENYISIAKTSRATATRDLNNLIEKNALIKTGLLRHTRYYLNLYRS
jgi:Fic family protein